MFRIGFGYDVHRLAEGESLILGGVQIEHYKGTVAHSDGDVLYHAIIDALLGAAALGDIGRHFPDNDQTYKNIDSSILLRKTIELLENNGYKVNNIDTTIAAQKPKLAPFVELMRKNISEICNTSVDAVSVKATTTEKLGFEGREEGISAYCVVSIVTKT